MNLIYSWAEHMHVSSVVLAYFFKSGFVPQTESKETGCPQMSRPNWAGIFAVKAALASTNNHSQTQHNRSGFAQNKTEKQWGGWTQ